MKIFIGYPWLNDSNESELFLWALLYWIPFPLYDTTLQKFGQEFFFNEVLGLYYYRNGSKGSCSLEKCTIFKWKRRELSNLLPHAIHAVKSFCHFELLKTTNYLTNSLLNSNCLTHKNLLINWGQLSTGPYEKCEQGNWTYIFLENPLVY